MVLLCLCAPPRVGAFSVPAQEGKAAAWSSAVGWLLVAWWETKREPSVSTPSLVHGHSWLWVARELGTVGLLEPEGTVGLPGFVLGVGNRAGRTVQWPKC